MLNRFKDAVKGSTPRNNSKDGDEIPHPPKPEKYCYSRPHFLGLTYEEVLASRDFAMRPIMTPRDISQMPLQAGYAELVYHSSHAKTNNLGLRPGLTQTSLCSHRRRLKACDFGFKKKMDCTICVAKTKALISFAVTAKLVCTPGLHLCFRRCRLLVFSCEGSYHFFSKL